MATYYKDPATGQWVKQPGGSTGPAGANGKSAYELAVKNGFSGTEAQWLASLRGADGAAGPQGEKGDPGVDGAAGPKGEQGEKGDTGAAGAAGKSAYDYAKDGGYTGTEEAFAQKLAQELPTSLPNPNALTVNGIRYDGSEAVDITLEGSVTTDGETVTVLSDNLFDRTTVTMGQLFYHSSNGPVLTTSTDVCWAYVPLRGAGTYRTKVNFQEHGTFATRVPILTEDKVFLQNVTGTVTETGNRYAADLEFTITLDMVANGAALLAFDCHTTILSTVMIVKDIAYPSEYIPYGYIEVAVESENVYEKHDNILRGKTALFLGDSICAGTTTLADAEEYGYGWGGIIGKANHMVWKNYGRNGGTVTNLAAVAQERWLSTQLSNAIAAYPQADYILLEGGCNDADQMKDAGLGSIATGYATFDTTTFSGALENLIRTLLTAYPTAKVGYIIPQKMYVQNDHTATGHVHRRFFDRAVEICEKWGIPVLDLWKQNSMNPCLSSYYDSSLTADEANAAGKCYTDSQHLTLTGYRRITPQIEAFMRSL